MQLLFTKGAGKHDRMDILRGGACTGNVECPKQGIIPHDMVHYAVESTLQRRGFVSRTLEGDTDGFRMTSTPESDGVERLVEVLQADGWSGWTGDATALLDLYHTTCDARGCLPLPLEVRDILAVREVIHGLTARWQQVPVGGAMTVTLAR